MPADAAKESESDTQIMSELKEAGCAKERNFSSSSFHRLCYQVGVFKVALGQQQQQLFFFLMNCRPRSCTGPLFACGVMHTPRDKEEKVLGPPPLPPYLAAAYKQIRMRNTHMEKIYIRYTWRAV